MKRFVAALLIAAVAFPIAATADQTTAVVPGLQGAKTANPTLTDLLILQGLRSRGRGGVKTGVANPIMDMSSMYGTPVEVTPPPETTTKSKSSLTDKRADAQRLKEQQRATAKANLEKKAQEKKEKAKKAQEAKKEKATKKTTDTEK
jgi:hypothetical protein